MPGLTDTLLGKQQKTFRLLTEETAIKRHFAVGAVATAANQFEAGEVGLLDETSGTAIRPTAAIAVGKLYGVFFDTHTTTLDECAGSGLGTLITNTHIGQTKRFIAGEAYAAGKLLYVDVTTNDKGEFTLTSTTNGDPVAVVVAYDGTWLTYHWLGAVTL